MAAWSNERPNVLEKNSYVINMRCKTTNIMLGTMPGDEDIFRKFILSKSPNALTMEQEIEASGIDKVERSGMTVLPRGLFYIADDGRYFDPVYGNTPNPEEVPGHLEIMPFIWDYQWRGSFKESIGMIQRGGGKLKKAPAKKKSKKDEDAENTVMPESADEARAAEEAAANEAAAAAGKFACSKITAYKKVVDGNWFVRQRRIPLYVPKTYIDDIGNVQSSYEDVTITPEEMEEIGINVPFLKTYSRALRAETLQGPRVAIAKSEFVPAGTEMWFTVELMNPGDKDALIECMDLKAKVGMLQWRSGGKGTLIWTPCDDHGNPIDKIPD